MNLYLNVRWRVICIFLLLFMGGCRRWFVKECRSGYSINSGEIIYGLAYNCLAFNPDDKGDTFAITRSGQWDTVWAEIQSKYSGDCPKPNIDFSRNSVLAFYQTSRTNDKILRNVEFVDAEKKVIYTITKVKCKNSLRDDLQLGFSYNYVVTNRIPAGYIIEYRSKSD